MKSIASIPAILAASVLTASAEVATDTVWGYRANDPSMVHSSKWAEHWEACGGVRQSPIDIKTVAKSPACQPSPISFSGSCSQYNLTEPHEPLEVDIIGGDCVATVNDAAYNMAQFHLHAPSEHTVDGKAHDAEIHFVHMRNNSSALMVVGIFLDIAPTSDVWLGPLLDALENVNSTEHQNEAITVELESYSELIQKASKTGGIYNYPGSLTTPGCDETADWWVVMNPIQISSADFDRLHKDLLVYHITDDGNNARPVQPLNGRTVTRYD
ncbi:hypothetical protein PHYSODRAFT_253570 [Phytophthora sojae]|uniref:Carbonic anhydrase n=1 Tax=Phytophthora sojae (strain P6497) TaxID=1094619 RepID=G4YZM5_PHYSP|nr:hypothetical protein PHYSODRAFT_486393 [Phytophthora sojae]XP_009521238.1 hypothetical protein PHYSODRAFT_253570 [Phytophthora sojae]EGZ25793.1 hypothetical protein PHYSODRAFT_486393 [Phytophthora sojae]EGZ25950.1 hypothetical protein PHYSODRAFT_253570 [Phytophthora sojae]|eukprot:XP_009521081.1 hypothetical protein PHYSODRAFT_486393 [Phytophthora sojae]